MRLKTILNRIEKHQGFLYDAVRLEEEDRRLVIEVAIRPRAHSRPTCSGCQQPGAGYEMAHLSKAIDEVRAAEARALKAQGREPVLTHTRWLLLKRPETLTEAQEGRLAELLRYTLKAVRACLLKEDLQFFWTSLSPAWAGRFLDRWCTRTGRSRLEPMQTVARMLRRHRALLLNWFRAKGSISNGAVEGFNNKAKLTTRRAYGFRTFRAIEVALYHALGNLPEPQATHRFC